MFSRVSCPLLAHVGQLSSFVFLPFRLPKRIRVISNETGRTWTNFASVKLLVTDRPTLSEVSFFLDRSSFAWNPAPSLLGITIFIKIVERVARTRQIPSTATCRREYVIRQGKSSREDNNDNSRGLYASFPSYPELFFLRIDLRVERDDTNLPGTL